MTADAAAAAVLDDPGQAYTDEVKSALIDAMIDLRRHSRLPTISGSPSPRATTRTHASAATPYDVSTIILRIRGDELAAYRAGRITKQDVLKRVQVREY